MKQYIFLKRNKVALNIFSNNKTVELSDTLSYTDKISCLRSIRKWIKLGDPSGFRHSCQETCRESIVEVGHLLILLSNSREPLKFSLELMFKTCPLLIFLHTAEDHQPVPLLLQGTLKKSILRRQYENVIDPWKSES